MSEATFIEYNVPSVAEVDRQSVDQGPIVAVEPEPLTVLIPMTLCNLHNKVFQADQSVCLGCHDAAVAAAVKRRPAPRVGGFNKKAYMKEYMRKRRLAARKKKEAAMVAPKVDGPVVLAHTFDIPMADRGVLPVEPDPAP